MVDKDQEEIPYYKTPEYQHQKQLEYRKRVQANPEARERRMMAMYRSYAKNYAQKAPVTNQELRSFADEIVNIVESRIADQQKNEH